MSRLFVFSAPRWIQQASASLKESHLYHLRLKIVAQHVLIRNILWSDGKQSLILYVIIPDTVEVAFSFTSPLGSILHEGSVEIAGYSLRPDKIFGKDKPTGLSTRS